MHDHRWTSTRMPLSGTFSPSILSPPPHPLLLSCLLFFCSLHFAVFALRTVLLAIGTAHCRAVDEWVDNVLLKAPVLPQVGREPEGEPSLTASPLLGESGAVGLPLLHRSWPGRAGQLLPLPSNEAQKTCLFVGRMAFLFLPRQECEAVWSTRGYRCKPIGRCRKSGTPRDRSL